MARWKNSTAFIQNIIAGPMDGPDLQFFDPLQRSGRSHRFLGIFTNQDQGHIFHMKSYSPVQMSSHICAIQRLSITRVLSHVCQHIDQIRIPAHMRCIYRVSHYPNENRQHTFTTHGMSLPHSMYQIFITKISIPYCKVMLGLGRFVSEALG